MSSRTSSYEDAPNRSVGGAAHASFQGVIGLARADITPPVGIYARNWGAARHEVASSIHRPLTLTALTLAQDEQSEPLVLIDADLGWWRSRELFQSFRNQVLEMLSLEHPSLILALSHTHAGPVLAEIESDLPGSDLLANYLEQLVATSIETVKAALEGARPSVLDWHVGRCQLAKCRDLRDPTPGQNRFVCGFDPSGSPDDTLVLGRVTDAEGDTRAVLVNYACHPTTLAWENAAISPDFIGAMRETIELQVEGALALFLQGASGELAPGYQYVGEPSVADRHGRQLGFAALATLEDMKPAGQEMVFDRVVESGAPLAVWNHEPVELSPRLSARQETIELPLKPWPSAEALEQQRVACEDRAVQERLRRRRDIRRELGDGDHYRLPLHIWRMGDAILVGSMAEAYSSQQVQLRQRFPKKTIIVMNLINGSIGYLPPASLYDSDIYQVEQTPFARGSLEAMIEAFTQVIRAELGNDAQEIGSATNE